MNFTNKWFVIVACLVFLFQPSTSFELDAITQNRPINDGDVLVSSDRKFALGFFSPGKSLYRYVGVWYYQIPNQTIVWVANRDNPVPANDTSGFLAIHGNGGLVIYGKDRSTPIWSANVTLSSPNSSVAKLLDTGNLVLLENESSQHALWEGFDYPSNTMLPSMKLGFNRRSGSERFLTSWKSEDDPGIGTCVYRLDPNGLPQIILYKNGAIRWRGGSWTGKGLSGIPDRTETKFIFDVSFVDDETEVSIVYVVTDETIFSRTVLDESGTIERSTWNGQWTNIWSAPIQRCDNYGRCGRNGKCDPDDVGTVECTCLPGYEPKSPTDWYLRDGSEGCVQAKGVSMCGEGEGFVKISRLKIPESSEALVNMKLSLKECRRECLKNCFCTAYSTVNGTSEGGCVTWYGDLMDIRTFANVGQELYLRVNASVLGKKRPDKVVSRVGSMYLEKSIGDLDDQSTINSSELPFFDLSIISAATNNFSASNKLGAGGFGSVYKGVLSNGKDIAVKRLSKQSGQGTEEFKNEVMLIAKLQHRNLVRIFGCCVQDEEKMLIYEYVPNKSLDYFIFNETNRTLLDWKRRFEIICGIARGILYLHQDSRLRIIHRDLKASNVLLDASMNPKIADFGLARIFRGDQNEALTNRVVGTYGYMSPEYAMEGSYSVKSDVYSFGILLLEIISGRKNSGYYDETYPDSNLVGHVWNLWRDNNALEIVDSSLGDPIQFDEILRCIQIALLCVQDFPTERPTMSAVLVMLSNDATLPPPGKPAFIVKKAGTSEDNSINYVTCSIVRAR
ncbi:G-type lectin S-receptor-like serine/threonine-protein kinase At1g11410 isoform X2 [Argentina anserina]|uniref:G-type lectin S-receptor-like serine/threonine-protein kinase At1g11410 isoform X2 n=1 Tax=Argentina anserina TaxID=57926 RepID=UPI0021769252|nr:G-type lectin S-receptor-like serine/threonine-protein kinase At1g11410 isoform X2 [Potentilla anserina]